MVKQRIAAASLFIALASCGQTPKHDRPPRPVLSAAETADLQRSNGRLCQNAIGFHIDDPGPEYSPRADLGQGGGNVRMWIWESGETHERLVITVIKAMGETPDGFREWAAGTRAGVAEQGQVEEESVDTDARPYVANLNTRLKNGNAYSSRCLGTGDSGEMPWTICAATVSVDHTALKPLRESLAMGTCASP